MARSKYWWLFPRWSEEYRKGVDRYIEKMFTIEAQGDEIKCPCRSCYFRNWYRQGVVKDHMIAKGVVELPGEDEVEQIENMDTEVQFDDNIVDLLNDTFRGSSDKDAEKFCKLVKEGQQELYPGCKSFSTLSFIVRLLLYKRDHKLSNRAITELLKILKDMQPDAQLPKSYNQVKITLKALGMDYIKIDACPNDCILYWEENANATCCHVCKTSRWKSEKVDENSGKVRRISAKILRYFPIKKRLQRLFLCPETAHMMTWHANERPKDGLLRHQAPKYITPGSLGAYNDMIKMRTNRQLNFNANEIELDNLLNKMPAVDTINTLNDVPSEEETSINQDEVVADQETSVENQTLVTAPAKKKNRGRSILADLHKRTAEKRIHIVLNDLHQPVGPFKKDVTDFIHFLGIVAKDPILTPPNVHSWKYVPTKDKIWEYVMTRFDVDEVAKKFVLTTVNDIWRSHKNRLKKAAYKFETKEERLANRPQNIPEIQYKELLDFWELDEIKEKSRKNSENVKNRVDYHTMGPFSYAMKKIEMEENHPNKKKPSQAELYIESRKRVPGRTYKTDPKQALQNIEKMKEKQSLPDTVDKGDPYYDVITKEEHSGRLRLYGRTVTKKTLKESVGNAPYVLPPKYMESIEKHLEQKITERILSQLKEANPGINIKITSGDDEVGGSNEASDSAANHSNQDHHQVDEE